MSEREWAISVLNAIIDSGIKYRFCHDWSDYINESNIIYQGDSLGEGELEYYLKEDVNKTGYIISIDMKYDQKNYRLKA